MDDNDVSRMTTLEDERLLENLLRSNRDNTLLLSSTSYFGHSVSDVRLAYADAAVRNQFMIYEKKMEEKYFCLSRCVGFLYENVERKLCNR